MRKSGVLFAFILFIIFYLILSVGKYITYNAYAYDLGIYAQSSWFISHFQMPLSTIRGINQLGDHFSPVYILLSLPYRFFNTPIYLLVIQALSVVLGGVPLYLISKEKIKSELSMFLLIFAYFLQIGLISAINFDFHLSTLSVGFISWTLYFWYKGNVRWYLIFLILSLLTKEDITILFFFFSIYLLLRKERKVGLTTLFLSLTWYLTAVRIVIPHFLGQPYGYDHVGNFLDGIDVKAETVFKTLGQNLGISLLNPLGWFFVVPNFLTRFLSTGEPRWSSDWHYGANIASPMFISTILFLGKIKNQKFVFLLSLLILSSTIYLGWPIIPKYHSNDKDSLNKIISQIPANSSVSAQDILVPHLANRKEIYLFPAGEESDYIALAKGAPSFPVDPDRINKEIKRLTSDQSYRWWQEGDCYLFRKL